MKRAIFVKKASGEIEKYRPEKIKRTLLRAGAGDSLAESIIKTVEERLYNGITTREIYKMAMKKLGKIEPVVAAKYSLKEAIMKLGPAGYSFEKFFTAILKEYGYAARTHVFVQGRCVKHEIDVIASKPTKLETSSYKPPLIHYMIENKFHNMPGIYTGLKEVLYTYARYLDLHEGFKEGLCEKFDEPWLVTNTKFSGDAIEYSVCKRMKLTGWKYPAGNSLEEMIENKKLYPITVLQTLDRYTQDKLINAGFILCKDILTKNINKISERSGLPLNKISKIREDISKLC